MTRCLPLAGLLLSLGCSLAVAQVPANPQAPAGQASPTAPNAQGMMTDPSPAASTQAPSGVPGSQNVNPGERGQPPATRPAALPPDSPAPRNPPTPPTR